MDIHLLFFTFFVCVSVSLNYLTNVLHDKMRIISPQIVKYSGMLIEVAIVMTWAGLFESRLKLTQDKKLPKH